MAMREFWLLTTFFLVALRRALTVAWIRINKFLTNPDWLIRPVTSFRHKVRRAQFSFLCILAELFNDNKELLPYLTPRTEKGNDVSPAACSLGSWPSGCPINILEQRRRSSRGGDLSHKCVCTS